MNTIIIPSNESLPVTMQEFDSIEDAYNYFGPEGNVPCMENVRGLGSGVDVTAFVDDFPYVDGHNKLVNARGGAYLGRGGTYVGDIILVGGKMYADDLGGDLPLSIEDVEERIEKNSAPDFDPADAVLASV